MAAKQKAATEGVEAVKPGVPHKLTPEEIASVCAQVADDRKAMNIVKLKMAGLSSVTDYAVICTGTSEPHLNALAERIQRELRNSFKVRPVHVDGENIPPVVKRHLEERRFGHRPCIIDQHVHLVPVRDLVAAGDRERRLDVGARRGEAGLVAVTRVRGAADAERRQRHHGGDRRRAREKAHRFVV